MYVSDGETADHTMWKQLTITNAADMTLSNRMQPVHPGEILQDELNEIGLSSKGFETFWWTHVSR